MVFAEKADCRLFCPLHEGERDYASSRAISDRLRRTASAIRTAMRMTIVLYLALTLSSNNAEI